MKRALPYILTLPMLAAFACLEGGANQNGNHAGNKDGGVQLWLGEIAVDADGRFFLSRSDEHLVVGDLEIGTLDVIDEIRVPDVLAFRPDGSPGFFAVNVALGKESQILETVTSYDLSTRSIVWQRELPRWDFTMDVTSDGERLLLTYADSVLILDAENGTQLAEIVLDQPAIDVDLVADERIVVMEQQTRDGENLPHARVSVWSALDGSAVCDVVIPNCHSELVVNRSGERAFVAPTRCGRDPISVVDLEQCNFRGNLPGFGPVALSPDGETVVGFMDRDANDPLAPPLPEDVLTSQDRYHLMFVETESLDYTTAPIGDLLPRYAFTPNGATLIVDHDVDRDRSRTGPLVLLDTEAKTIRTVEGPEVELHEYALTPDSSRAFIVDAALFRLSIDDAKTDRIGLSYTPTSVNITPSGDTLLLKDAVYGSVHLYDIASSAEGATLSL